MIINNVFYTYRLINYQTNYFYIGSTNDLVERNASHLLQLRNGTHFNYRLQNAYCDNVNFTMEQLSIHNTRNEAFQYEQFLIGLSLEDSKLLNLDFYGIHNISEETRKKQSMSGKLSFTNNPERKQYLSTITKERMKDIKLLEHLSTVAKKRNSCDEMRKKLSNIATELMRDSGRRNNLAIKATIQMQDPHNRELSRQGAIKQWENPEYREKRCRKIIVNGIEYPSIVEASIQLNVNKTTVRKRCLNNNNNKYNFIEKDNKCETITDMDS